ncbi:MAG TPA: DUF4337 domain-containing protein [Acidobacteriaceae bacterium]|jgi:hypothetical protein
MEANEIHEFSEQMQEGGEKSMMYVSLIISVLAVLVAMVTVLGHREHTEAVLMQARAVDQWNEYQSHRIRQETVAAIADSLAQQSTPNPAVTKAVVEDFRARVEKWQKAGDTETEKAHELEREVDIAEHRAARYDLGEALLQIAVVLASVTLLTRRPSFVLAAVLLGAGGLITAVTALLVH